MSLRCYYRFGGNEIHDGITCEARVFDEEGEDQLKQDGWRRSPHDLSAPVAEKTDEVLELLRKTAKERGIKGYARMGEEKLREVLGLNDGHDQE